MFIKRNNFTDEDKKKMMDLYNDGLLYKEIASEFNTQCSSVARVIQSSGLPSRHPQLTKEREEQVLQLYEKYKNIQRVADELRMNSKTAHSVLEKYNVYIYTNSEVHQKYTLDSHYFDVIDTPHKAYIFGFLYADGTANRKTGVIAISLQEGDSYILEFMKEELQTNIPLSFRDYQSKKSNYKNQYCLTITNRHMHDALVNHGLVPNKSMACDFPKCLPKELYPCFILGYMDGDGTINRNPKDKRCSFLGTKDFIEQAKNIIENELNIHCSICYTHGKDRPTRTLRIAGGIQVKKFLDWLYNSTDVYLIRKYNIYKDLYL